MNGGYMNKYVFVDLSSGKIEDIFFNEKEKREYIGGYGLGCKFIYENQKPYTDPLSEDNILAFMTGPVNGTNMPGSPRYTVCGKSPLTKTWGDSNCGGSFGPMMKKAGFDGIFFSGISEKPVYLLLNNSEIKIKDASFLWGQDTYKTEDELRAIHGKDSEIACIGPYGEKMSLTSCIISRKGRAAGRSGLGALMGSKKIKAIVTVGQREVPIANKVLYEEARKEFLKNIKNDFGDAEWLKKGGTPTITKWSIDESDSPIKNWGGSLKDMPNYDELSWENIKKYVIKRESCYRCPLACWSLSTIDHGDYKLTEPAHTPEYETGALFGSLLLNTNYESIIKCNDLCNRYGADTISLATTVSFAMECYEKGVLSKDDFDGISLDWGDRKAIVQLTEKILNREGIGDLLADGVKIASEKIGKGSEEFAMHVGGQEVPAHHTLYDPSLAITYTFEPTPARHMQGNQNLGHKDFSDLFPDIDFSFCGGGNKNVYKGRAKEIKINLFFTHGINIMGACIFAAGATSVKTHIKYLSAITGWDIDLDEFLTAGERAMNLRQVFNIREGINPKSFKLSNRLLGIPPVDNGKISGITIDFDSMVSEFYREMDWDFNTNLPNKEKLEKLNLSWLIKDI